MSTAVVCCSDQWSYPSGATAAASVAAASITAAAARLRTAAVAGSEASDSIGVFYPEVHSRAFSPKVHLDGNRASSEGTAANCRSVCDLAASDSIGVLVGLRAGPQSSTTIGGGLAARAERGRAWSW